MTVSAPVSPKCMRCRREPLLPSLLAMTTTIGTLCRTAVSSSIAERPKAKSPQIGDDGLLRMLDLRRQRIRDAYAQAAAGAGREPAHRKVRRDHSLACRHDKVTVEDRDRILRQGIAQLAREAPRRYPRRVASGLCLAPGVRPLPRLRQLGQPGAIATDLRLLTTRPGRLRKQLAQKRADVGVHTKGSLGRTVQFRGMHIDADDGGVRRKVPAIAKGPVQSRAQHQDHIRTRLRDPGNRVHAERVVVGDRAASDRRGDERKRQRVDQLAQRGERR